MSQQRLVSLTTALVFSAALIAAALIIALFHPASKRVLVLSTSPVLAAKFTHLADVAAPQGITLEGYLAEALPETPLDASLYDLVILDTPGNHNVRFVKEKAAAFLAAYDGMLLQTGRSGYEAKQIDDATAKQLHDYYFNGSSLNFSQMFAYMRKHLWNESVAEPNPPVVFDKVGIYHPDFEGLIFPTTQAYFAWKGVKPDDTRPVIAVAHHKNYIASGTTAHLDALIRSIEAKGAIALPFYDSVVDSSGIESVLMKEGKTLCNAIISQQIVLAPESRKAVFEKLGVPVLHTLLYREGDEAAWEKDRVGLEAGSVPFFLANAEFAGMIDPMTIAVVGADGAPKPLPRQIDSVVNKALGYAGLQRTPAAEKKLALMFYNYPSKESGISASFMNAPKSIEAILKALKTSGYAVTTPDEATLLTKLQELLRGLHRAEATEPLVGKMLGEYLPAAEYHAWFDALPTPVKDRINARWGAPEEDPMFVKEKGFVIPAYAAGNLLIMPQPPRGHRDEPKENALYHDMSVPVNHFYLAVYLYVRQHAQALIHLGTHGSQEWTYGKERGLSVFDDPFLTLGDIPVVYPYIVDNIGEATQTKRRGRAVNITHMTPAFIASGLYRELGDIHSLIHDYLAADKGLVKEKIREQIIATAKAQNPLWGDLGWDEARAEAEFETFTKELHDHLHTLASQSRPMGLHTFGKAPDLNQRVHTTVQMLGDDLLKRLGGNEWDELTTVDYSELNQSKPYRQVMQWLSAPSAPKDAMGKTARTFGDNQANPLEMPRLLDALSGRHIPTKYGGDPIRNPESLPTGFNHYGFDASRVPTQAAWEAGKIALDQLIAAHRAENGEAPKKLAFTMWSVETMRHFGILEAQVLYALGVEPVWDRGGRVSGVKLIPRSELGRARIDTVISATGLYRDQFPNAMLRMNEAVALVSDLNDSNPIAAATRATFDELVAKGVPEAKARLLSKIRVFSNESGVYGSNLEDAALASDTWEAEGKLADMYLNRMQYAFGEGLESGGEKVAQMNLYAQNLKGVDAAVLSRSSNLYGMLTTDDPFQYLGGLSLAVRHINGKSPKLYISNLRDPKKGKVEDAAKFMARELATREFHPGYIEELMQEGHAGSLAMTGSLENFWGWQVMDPDMVRDDQWQAFHDIYVDDKYQMQLREWMEQTNPEALAQMVERMLEAVRKEYWKADEKTLKNLIENYQQLHQDHDLLPLHDKLEAFVAEQAAGFGIGAPLSGGSVSGMKLEKQNAAQSAAATPLPYALLGIVLLVLLGALYQYVRTQLYFRKETTK